MNLSAAQAQHFKDTLVLAAEKVCPLYGVDIETCIEASAAATWFGKFAIHNNYFDLAGSGDRGYNVYVVVERTTDIQNGGCKVLTIKKARFSSAEASVRAYCEGQGRR